jgi:hypothetical protein
MLDEVANKFPSVKIALVDATVATTTAERFDIKSFPTIKYYKSKTFERYDGPKTIDDFSNLINKLNGIVALYIYICIYLFMNESLMINMYM